MYVSQWKFDPKSLQIYVPVRCRILGGPLFGAPCCPVIRWAPAAPECGWHPRSPPVVWRPLGLQMLGCILASLLWCGGPWGCKCLVASSLPPVVWRPLGLKMLGGILALPPVVWSTWGCRLRGWCGAPWGSRFGWSEPLFRLTKVWIKVGRNPPSDQQRCGSRGL